jgi:hypothetical protein
MPGLAERRCRAGLGVVIAVMVIVNMDSIIRYIKMRQM